MTSVRETVDLRAEHEGRWVQLNAWWAIEVYVSAEEIELARSRYDSSDYKRPAERTANAIAIGKMCGSYPRSEGDVRRRV